jgi:hypothetical protein
MVAGFGGWAVMPVPLRLQQVGRLSALSLADVGPGATGSPAITSSDRGQVIHGASCALRAGKRLHDPFHEDGI